MSPDRTAPTSLRPALAPRTSAPETAGDGFAALLGAAGAGHVRDDRRGDAAGPEVVVPRKHSAAEPDRAAAEPEAAVDPAAGAAPVLDAPSMPVVTGVPGIAAPVPVELPTPAAATPPPVAGGSSQPTEVAVASRPGMPAPVVETVQPATTQPQPATTAPLPATTSPLPVAGASSQPAEVAVPSLPGRPAPAVDTVRPATTQAQAAAVATPAAPTAAEPRPEAPVPGAPTFVPGAPAGAADSQGAGTTGEQGTAPREQPTSAPTPVAATPVAQTAPLPTAPVAPLATRAAPLHLAPRAVAQMLQVAVERGLSHAKLNLRPAELGGIEIRLQTSAAGVTAQVVADSPEAARLLHQAADDLRRSLERHDVTLLSLDVSTAGDDRPDGSAGASADLAGDRSRHFAAHGLTPPAATEADEPPTVVATVQLPDGLHVDVLA
jgi:hypothetical protein